MQTECSATLFEFEAVERRAVMAGFDGGDITSNAGALLLGQVDRGLGLIRRFAGCFTDRRDARYVEHRVETLVGQRIFGLVLGYEDLNDHDELRKDPTFGVLTGKLHPVLRSDCEALAGKSTLNQLEHTPNATPRSITGSIVTGHNCVGDRRHHCGSLGVQVRPRVGRVDRARATPALERWQTEARPRVQTRGPLFETFAHHWRDSGDAPTAG